MIEFPQSAAFGERITLAKLKRQGLGASLVSLVKEVTWAYKLAPSTVSLASTASVREVEVFDLRLKTAGEKLRKWAEVVSGLNAIVRNPFVVRIFSEDGEFIESAIVPKESNGALFGDSVIYRMAHSADDIGLPSGVTNLETLLIGLSAALAGISARSGEGLNGFIERHYRVESLRGELAEVERKQAKETQLARKYELAKDVRRLQKEVAKAAS